MVSVIRRLNILALLALCFALVPMARPAFAATYVVTNFTDTNTAGTLRRAINDANLSAGPDTITFSGPGKITLSSLLPELKGGSITIDGRQAGSGNTPRVEISGNGTVRQAGIYVTSSGNTITGLIVNGFLGTGILVEGLARTNTTANNNTITYNYIGTNAAGNAAGFNPPDNNDSGGVRINGRANGNTVANNVISGNGTISSSYGIYVGPNNELSDGLIASDNIVRDNIIGLNASGTAPLGNGSDGVRIDNDSRNTTVQNNVISANGGGSSGVGVNVAGQIGTGFITGNKILNNKIGTTATGTGTSGREFGNLFGGVILDYSQGTIVSGNLISGNINSGILVTQSQSSISTQVVLEAQITNNVIGLDGTGAQALGNSGSGIQVDRGVANVAITNNVISANNEDGIKIVGTNGTRTFTTAQVTVSGNTIGLDAGRSTVIGTQRYGVNIVNGAAGNSIDSNMISGNTQGGIILGDNRTAIVSNNQITNNQIGTRASGAAVGNGAIGVGIFNGATNTVGPGNSIIRNSVQSGEGVLIQGSTSSSNVIKGNTIQDNFRGVRVDFGAPNNTIGGTTTADINVVRNNRFGVVIISAGAIGNRILHTTTSNNELDGITLFSGGNAGLAAPTISSAQFAAGTLTLNLNSAADCTGVGCTIEVFQNTVQENGEGKYFLAATTKTGSASGAVPFAIASCMPWLTATITDKNGNTSPFSSAINAPGCTAGEPSTDVRPELSNPTPASQTVASGPVSFKATLKNLGGQAGNFNLSVSGLPATWNATVAPNPATNVGPNGGQAIEVTVNATIPTGADAGTYVATLSATAQVGSATSSVQATIIVPLVAGLAFTAATQPSQTGGPGERKCYDHTVTNTGNGPDTVTMSVTPPQGWQAEILTGPSFSLGRNEQRTVTICVTIPGGNTPAGNYNTSVTARTTGGAGPISVTDVTAVQAAAVPEISAAPEQNVTPTTAVQVTFQHTIRNIGNAADSFALNLTGLPSGWAVVSAPPAIVGPLNPGITSPQVSYTVQVPANATAGTYNLSFRATAQGGTNASVVVQDRVIVNRIAALTLTPATQTSTEEPDTTKTYDFTLKNDGNFTDQVTLGAAANQPGWNATTEPVGQVVLAAGASATVKLVVSIPPGQLTSVVNVATITATSLEGVSATAQATTNIASISKAKLTPKDPPGRRATAGQSITFDFTLQNSGSIGDTFDTVEASVVNSAGITVTTAITVETPITLAPGATTPVKLSIRVPDSQPDNSTIRVTVRSTPQANSSRFAETIATVVIGPPYDVIIDPDRQSANIPGELVRYTHFVTNTGSFEDSFELSTISNLGWETNVSPPSVRLQPGLSAAVEVTVRVPTSAQANAVGTTFVTARSGGDPTAVDQAIDSTRVAQVAGVNFAPSRTGLLTQGRSLVFSHTILNTGNGTDTFTITATQELNWGITLSTLQTPKMGRGVSYPLQLQVRIPINADPTLANRITLKVTSTFNGSVRQEVIDLVRPALPAPDEPGTNRVYLPYMRQ